MALDTVKDLLSVLLFKRVKEQRRANEGMGRWTVRKRIPILGWFIKRKADKQLLGMTWLQRKQAVISAKALRYMAKTKTLDDLSVLLSARKPKQTLRGKRMLEVDILL